MAPRAKAVLCILALSVCLSAICSETIHAQSQTLGLFQSDAEAQDGYTLFINLGDTDAYLLDIYGRVVHQWPGIARPNSSIYLMENGYLLRTCQALAGEEQGTRLQLLDWDGITIWNYEHPWDAGELHHDVAVTPDGNILAIVRSTKNSVEAQVAGRDPDWLPANGLYCESIIELKPIFPDSAAIVWEWHVWDHLVQDHDPGADNFGVIPDHPELININWEQDTRSDWLHPNGIDYNPSLDQIALSVRHTSEIWILDHSTSTEEAAGHQGGNSGMGGDIVYRWGNPQIYGRGTAEDQTLWVQHDVNWISPGLPGEGNLIVFCNGTGRPEGDYSTIEEWHAPVDGGGMYERPLAGGKFGPVSTTWTYQADPPEDFFSANISGCQRLPNGNTLICAGAIGHLFEVTADGDVVWDYICPLRQGTPQAQGLPPTMNRIFKVRRYTVDYPGLAGRDLTPGSPIETYAVTVAGTAHAPAEPLESDSVTITSTVTAEATITAVNLWLDDGSGFSAIEMHDDGAHGDGVAGDGVYGAIVPPNPGKSLKQYYVTAEDSEANLTIDPPSAPGTVYRYTTEVAGLNQTVLTIFREQSNRPELIDVVAPASGTPWTWTASNLTGFTVEPSLAFNYLNADHTRAEMTWSGIDDIDWLAGGECAFTLTLANGVDEDRVYSMSLSLRCMLGSGITVFKEHNEIGTAVCKPGVRGFNILVRNYTDLPKDFNLGFDANGTVTLATSATADWTEDGSVDLRIVDQGGLYSDIEAWPISLRRLSGEEMVLFQGQIDGSSVVSAPSSDTYAVSLLDTKGLPPDLQVDFDVEGAVTLCESDLADWTESGRASLRIIDGDRPACTITNWPVSLQRILPRPLMIPDTPGQGGELALEVFGDTGPWEWLSYSDGLVNSVVTGEVTSHSPTLTLSWAAGDLVSGEVGTGVVTIQSSDEGSPSAIVAVPTEVALSCCTGPSVGNVDGSADNEITMSDLTILIDRLFITLTPLACDVEGNLDMSADGEITMGDLTVMIDHLFITLTPLPNCP